ncbi:MAG: hypothetical protein QOJ88_1731 [Pyrinomonadaceae bacterium]|jgi:hypothetical protein|nr:hypothetical protein [Pyrinomonadaceae bacterium]
MGTSRRDFLKKGSLVAIAAGVPLSLTQSALGRKDASPEVPLGLTKEGFEAQLNTTFLISDGSEKIGLRLVNVTDLRRRESPAGKEGFSLLFKGDESTALKQNTYVIEHDKLGLFSFLIVPVMSRQKKTRHYEAIINRLQP